MNQSLPTKKRRWLPRYGMRAIFVLIGLAALVAWWVRGEMLAEQRREELIAEFSQSPNRLDMGPNPKPTWRQRFIALLRGKKIPPLVLGAQINRIGDPQRLIEFEKTFPVKFFWVQAAPNETTPEVLDALAQCHSISHLNFTGEMSKSDETLQRLARIRQKSGFTFWTQSVDDVFLKRVADAGVDCGRIGDAGAALQGSWFHVTDEGLRSAATLKKLTSLIANRNASDQGLAAFRDHPTLAEVQLVGPSYTEASGDILATLPSLHSLSLIETKWNDEAVAKAISGRRIGSLKLHDIEIGEKTIDAIANSMSLHTIDLKNVPLSPELVAALAKCPISSLTLDGDYDDQLMAGFAPIAPSVNWLSVASPSTTDAGLAWIAKAPTLWNLHLRDTSITGATLRAPPGRGMMGALTLGGPHVNKQTLADTQTMPGLAQIMLYGETIDDEALAALPATIRSLQLVGTRVTVAGLKAFPRDEHEIYLLVQYPEGSEPPFSAEEIEDLQTATQGRMKVTLYPLPETTYQEMLPRSSRAD